MTNDGRYNCTAAFPAFSGEAVVRIGDTELEIAADSGAFALDYARIRSFCLQNYHFLFETSDGPAELSQMGHDTEGFYEALWLAYNRRSREALFVETAPQMDAEGDYGYTDDGGGAKGTAKVSLHPACICILPPDSGARRIPLCFVSSMERDNYTIRIALDTGERYEIARFGRDTIPFYENLSKNSGQIKRQWRQAHTSLEAALETRLGDALERFRFFREIGSRVVSGLFSPDSPEFWIAAFRGGTAAVELVAGERTATYLYRVKGDEKIFENRLRHAMEAMGLHREILYMDEEALRANSLYAMSEERNAHLRFLRGCMSGRVIHTEAWNKKIAESMTLRE